MEDIPSSSDINVVEGTVERPVSLLRQRSAVARPIDGEENINGQLAAGGSAEEEDLEDLMEPRFKYKRVMGEDLQRVFASESASCFAVHSKFIAMGMQSGWVYIMDHAGNVHRDYSRRSHGCAVSHIDIDKAGDYIMSCANDAKVVIFGFGTDEFNQILRLRRPARAIALADDHGKASSGQCFAIGDSCLTVYERRFVLKQKETVVYQGRDRDGLISKISWCGCYIAFTNETGTMIYDRTWGKTITSVKRDHSSDLSSSQYPAQHCWLNGETIAIGWANTVAVCRITTSADGILSGDLKPPKFGELLHRFTLDTYVAGISFTTNGYGGDNGVGAYGDAHWREIVCFCLRKDEKPLAQIELSNGVEIAEQATGSSSIAGFSRNQILLLESDGYDKHRTVGEDSIIMRDGDAVKLNQCHMIGLPDDTIYFLLVARDLVTANEISPDDHIFWLIENKQYREAFDYAEDHAGKLKRTTVLDVGRMLLDYLLSIGQYQKAAAKLKAVCGKRKDVWEAYVSEFERAKCVLLLASVLPLKEPQLEPECYEYVLNAALEQNALIFRKLVRSWNADLYRVGAIADSTANFMYKKTKELTAEPAKTTANDVALIQALAHMYAYERNYDNALKLYLMIRDRNVFVMIDQHQLFPKWVSMRQLVLEATHEFLMMITQIFCVPETMRQISRSCVISRFLPDLLPSLHKVKDRISELMSIDADLAVRLLLKNAEHVAPKEVLRQISKQPKLQMLYLNRLIARHEGGEFSDLAIRLYADYDRPKLMPLLRSAENYKIDQALRICQQKQFMQETVFLLGRSGNRSEALRVIVEQQQRFDMAIEFCREHDEPHLWTTLIQAAMKKPEHITELLRIVGTCFDPLTVVEQIPCGMVIPGLRDSLIKVIGDYALQIQLQNGCRLVTVEDVVDLMKKMRAGADMGTKVVVGNVCPICRDHFLIGDRPATYVPMDALLLGCGHMVHRSCEVERFSDAIDPDTNTAPCPICSEPVPDF